MKIAMRTHPYSQGINDYPNKKYPEGFLKSIKTAHPEIDGMIINGIDSVDSYDRMLSIEKKYVLMSTIILKPGSYPTREKETYSDTINTLFRMMYHDNELVKIVVINIQITDKPKEHPLSFLIS
jgi:hypothetical protein